MINVINTPVFIMSVLQAENALKRKREYKKDSIYVTDLYTLTFDENETLESLGSIVENVSNLIFTF